MGVALVFPGQGSQAVGMGEDLRRWSTAAEAVFALADEATGLPLRAVCANGPEDTLTDTVYAQPAVVAHSLAALAALQEALATAGAPLRPIFCAGHSAGELAALAAAGFLDTSSVLHLVARRAALMAEVCRSMDGTMAAILGLDEGTVRTLCDEASGATGEWVQIANLNAPGQIVVSGHRLAVDAAGQLARQRGARRVLPLKVAGAFHSRYMEPAARAFAQEVAKAPLVDGAVPVVLNLTAEPTTEAAVVRGELEEQIVAPVRWADSVRYMADHGCRVFVELGPGQVLSGLIRRVAPDATVLNVEDVPSLEAAVAHLAGSS